MSIIAMVVAQLLFGPEDAAAWYLVTEGGIPAGWRLHLESGDRVKLVPVPVLRGLRPAHSIADGGGVQDPAEVVYW